VQSGHDKQLLMVSSRESDVVEKIITKSKRDYAQNKVVRNVSRLPNQWPV